MDIAVKDTDSLLQIVPCFDGKELDIETDVVRKGLAAISIKHPHCGCGLTSISNIHDITSSKLDSTVCVVGFKHRNSFWNLHRPELRKISWMQCCSPQSIQNIFQCHDYDKGEIYNTLPRNKMNIDKDLRDIQDIMEELKCDAASSKDINSHQPKGSSPLLRESPTFYRLSHPDATAFVGIECDIETDGNKDSQTNASPTETLPETSENKDHCCNKTL